MPPAAPEPLTPEALEAVLAQAKAERWTELALRGPGFEPPLGARALGNRASERVFTLRQRLDHVPPTLLGIDSLTSLDLAGNQIGDAGAEAIANNLSQLTALDLGSNRIGDAGARAIAAKLYRLKSLRLWSNNVGDAGAKDISKLKALDLLDLSGNRICKEGGQSISEIKSLHTLSLSDNPISDAGAKEIAKLSKLASLKLWYTKIGSKGAEAILDAWADQATSERRELLDLRGNKGFGALVPAEVLEQTDAQVIIAAWRARQAPEAGRAPLPEPDTVGEPAEPGMAVGAGSDARLTLVDPPLASGARDDAVGRELHAELLLALDRLIAATGQSNRLAEWRAAAMAARERLGAGPAEVRLSAVLRIERLRSLYQIDERRRVEVDPLIEPAEAGAAGALRDAVASANLYIATDPHLAEQQRRLADPEQVLPLSPEDVETVEADLEALELAEPALLDELRLARETAALGGPAGERARAWLAGSWRNLLREALRQALAAVRELAKAARASADETALQAKLGTVITVEEGKAVLDAMGLQAKLAAAEAGRRALGSLGRVWLVAEPEIGKGVGQAVKWGLLLLLARHLDLLPRLGWSTDFVATIARILGKAL